MVSFHSGWKSNKLEKNLQKVIAHSTTEVEYIYGPNKSHKRSNVVGRFGK